jgi:beta-N-acetylhexosaminidase
MIKTNTASAQRDRLIDNILGKLTLEQKVGQLFTYSFNNFLVTPYIVESITKLHCGGLRLSSYATAGKRGKYYNYSADDAYAYPKGVQPVRENWFASGFLGTLEPEQYAERINRLQEIAMERNPGIPLLMSIDQEGDYSHDYCYAGINLFPSAMGLTATGNPKLAYQACRATALQLSAMGLNMIHSPCLDVNINPRNPEIGIRSYSDDPELAAKFGLASMKGYQDGGLITTAKHFPGRGDSDIDAHYETPVLRVDRKRLDAVELLPYRKLIENGLDCIMIAHNAYTALDPAETIATVSPRILKDLLRKELGFQGVITTDAIAMGALMKKYGLPTACALALQSGADLVLCKMESECRDQAYWETVKYVQDGRIPEKDLDDKVRRILTMKHNRGLFKNKAQVNASKAKRWFKDRDVVKLCRTVAQKSAIVIRDKDNLLPVAKNAEILLVDQRVPDSHTGMNFLFHKLSFCEYMYRHSMNINAFDTEFFATSEDTPHGLSETSLVLRLAEKADIVVAVNHYWRIATKNNYELVRKVLAAGKKLILVTNSPYQFAIPPEAGTVICTFSSSPESMRIAADIIFGKAKPGGTWPLKDYRI